MGEQWSPKIAPARTEPMEAIRMFRSPAARFAASGTAIGIKIDIVP